MGKAVVLYNSRGGNTEKVAKNIAEGLEADCFNNKHIPNLQDYDLVVLGSWVIAGRISFAGSRYIKKLWKKNIEGKKVALFFTSGAPDDINPMGDKTNPRLIKDIMFEAMEKKLTTKSQITILPERFYSKGAFRMSKNSTPKEPLGHPSEEELLQARKFGENLKQHL
ncbi:flavodoxin family protein [Candidatus Lokiarchaeum ossiferum]|uniref:flavodoxin family protein n=1 Tax=Candidatus Lokiarchaeum ossiferum TaxID=2951803 RepID=UPI00352C9149